MVGLAVELATLHLSSDKVLSIDVGLIIEPAHSQCVPLGRFVKWPFVHQMQKNFFGCVTALGLMLNTDYVQVFKSEKNI